MKTLFLAVSVFIGTIACAQTDSITTNWSTISTVPPRTVTASDSTWVTGKFYPGIDSVLVPAVYSAMKTQYRKNNDGIVQERHRYYYHK